MVSETVTTVGDRAEGILSRSTGGSVTITSASVTTGGGLFRRHPGLFRFLLFGHHRQHGRRQRGRGHQRRPGGRYPGSLLSGDSRRQRLGRRDRHVQPGLVAFGGAYVGGPGNVALDSGSVSTGGANATGIHARTITGDIELTSGTVITMGATSRGIYAQRLATTTTAAATSPSTSLSVTTAGNYSDAIDARADGGDVDVTSGSVATSERNSFGIDAYAEGDGSPAPPTSPSRACRWKPPAATRPGSGRARNAAGTCRSPAGRSSRRATAAAASRPIPNIPETSSSTAPPSRPAANSSDAIDVSTESGSLTLTSGAIVTRAAAPAGSMPKRKMARSS